MVELMCVWVDVCACVIGVYRDWASFLVKREKSREALQPRSPGRPATIHRRDFPSFTRESLLLYALLY